MTGARLGFFTRLLDAGTDGERYRAALAQVRAAEENGFASAWVAQHHFDRDEGGLPSPFPFLAAAAVQTQRIALGTGIVTLPLDEPVRVAEDAAVVDALSGGRVQLGIGTGGTPSSFAAFERSSDDRREIQAAHVAVLRDAFGGRGIRNTDLRLNPAAPHLGGRFWQATFSVEGAAARDSRATACCCPARSRVTRGSRCTRCRCRSWRPISPPCPTAFRRASSPRAQRWWWMPTASTRPGGRPTTASGVLPAHSSRGMRRAISATSRGRPIRTWERSSRSSRRCPPTGPSPSPPTWRSRCTPSTRPPRSPSARSSCWRPRSRRGSAPHGRVRRRGAAPTRNAGPPLTQGQPRPSSIVRERAVCSRRASARAATAGIRSESARITIQ